MKLVVAILSKDNAEKTVEALMEAGHRATRIDSVGGFLKEKNSTILVGTEPTDVKRVLKTIGSVAKSHLEQVPAPAIAGDPGDFQLTDPVEVRVGGATVFILDVDQFEQL